VIDRTGEAYLRALRGQRHRRQSRRVSGSPLRATCRVGHHRLPARTRITSVGLRSQANDVFHLRKARIEVASGEGAFQPVTEVTLKDGRDMLFFEVKPSKPIACA